MVDEEARPGGHAGDAGEAGSAGRAVHTVLGPVPPAVVTTVLPSSCAMDCKPEAFFTAIRIWAMKVVTAKATSFWRASLFVVEPHSMSTVPFFTSGTRLTEVTAM